MSENPQAPEGTSPPVTAISWNEDSKTAALATATKAMNLYARPSVTEEEWIHDLAQVMTTQAITDYQYVDPANIPVTAVTEPGEIRLDTDNGFGCHVLFDTDAGRYDVQLLRHGPDGPWQVNRFTPPA